MTLTMCTSSSSGAGFVAFTTPSLDRAPAGLDLGESHRDVPWDGTELRVTQIEDSLPRRRRLVMGDVGPSQILAPVWADERPVSTSPDNRTG